MTPFLLREVCFSLFPQWIVEWHPAQRDCTYPGSCLQPQATELASTPLSTSLWKSASVQRQISLRKSKEKRKISKKWVVMLYTLQAKYWIAQRRLPRTHCALFLFNLTSPSPVRLLKGLWAAVQRAAQRKPDDGGGGRTVRPEMDAVSKRRWRKPSLLLCRPGSLQVSVSSRW